MLSTSSMHQRYNSSLASGCNAKGDVSPLTEYDVVLSPTDDDATQWRTTPKALGKAAMKGQAAPAAAVGGPEPAAGPFDFGLYRVPVCLLFAARWLVAIAG